VRLDDFEFSRPSTSAAFMAAARRAFKRGTKPLGQGLQVLMLLAYTAVMSLVLVLGSMYTVAKLILGPLEWYTTTSLHASQHTMIEAFMITYKITTAITKLIASTRAAQTVQNCMTSSATYITSNLLSIATTTQEIIKRPIAASSGWLLGGRSRRRRRVGNAFFGFMMACSRGNVGGAQIVPLEPEDLHFAYAEPPIGEFMAYQMHPVTPRVLTAKYQQWKSKRALLGEFPPWDPNVAPFMEAEGVTPPADSRPFFGEWSTRLSPPEQEPKHDPILEDPIDGESPYFFDEY
jgi:hypothetical protein